VTHRYVKLTAEEASLVLSAASDVSACPMCWVFGRAGGRRRGCEQLARASGFWSRTPDSLAAYIKVV